MPQGKPSSLRGQLLASQNLARRRMSSRSRSVALVDIAAGTALPDPGSLSGRSVLLLTKDMLAAALALIDLDGLARRLILCPPDLSEEHLPLVLEMGEVDVIVFDHDHPAVAGAGIVAAQLMSALAPLDLRSATDADTEWVMFTSGTAGPPKLVVHSLKGLVGAIPVSPVEDDPPIWGTFYDIRRYGGLQILLRALHGDGSLVLGEPDEDISDFLVRLGKSGVTHLTGTPSHWRSVLMSPAAHAISPKYIRLSGEIADQAVLDSLAAFFPGVPIVHAYASTEAGVGFEVTDGLEGFPAHLVDGDDGDVQMRVREGVLQLRSGRTARRYLWGEDELLDAEGFVDSGDMVERRGDRFFFIGRRGGIINVGGLKVNPEEVEAVINRHPSVQMSQVKGRRNPITGMVVVAEVVLNSHGLDQDAATVRDQILSACYENLARFKVPMRLSFVQSLPLSAGGKLLRADA